MFTSCKHKFVMFLCKVADNGEGSLETGLCIFLSLKRKWYLKFCWKHFKLIILKTISGKISLCPSISDCLVPRSQTLVNEMTARFNHCKLTDDMLIEHSSCETYIYISSLSLNLKQF
jgi:hypothetical protein